MSERPAGWARIDDLGNGVFVLAEPLVRSGLVEGERDIAVIDTGMGVVDIRAMIAGISEREPVVLQTHGHWDHVGGSHLFERVLIHPDAVNGLRAGMEHEDYLRTMARFSSLMPMPDSWKTETAYIPGVEPSGFLSDGDTIDLGGRVIEAYATPGHAAGGLSFLDRTGRVLFVGDAINVATMLLCLEGSDPLAFAEALETILRLAEQVDMVVPGHGPMMTADDVREVRDAWAEVLAGRAPSGQEDLDLGMATTIAVDVYGFERFEFRVRQGALTGSG